MNHVFALQQVNYLLAYWYAGCVQTLSRMTACFIERLTQAVEKVRPHRSFPRKHAIGGAQRPRKAYRTG